MSEKINEKKSLVERAYDIPREYRRDICQECGGIIRFLQHRVTVRVHTHYSGSPGDTDDVAYTNGFGFAEHKSCYTPRNNEFYERLGDSIHRLDKRLIKPSSQPLKAIKSLLYNLGDFVGDTFGVR